jgi:hypothetical protein
MICLLGNGIKSIIFLINYLFLKYQKELIKLDRLFLFDFKNSRQLIKHGIKNKYDLNHLFNEIHFRLLLKGY